MDKEFVVLETKFWKAILINEQAYLGRCVVLLKRDCANLSSLTSGEWQDFHENIIKRLESALKNAFGATMFNWSCLMNNAYQEENPKPYVHFHFRPRYKDRVIFKGEEFLDSEFGYHYNPKGKHIVSTKTLKEIFEKIKRCLNEK